MRLAGAGDRSGTRRVAAHALQPSAAGRDRRSDRGEGDDIHDVRFEAELVLEEGSADGSGGGCEGARPYSGEGARKEHRCNQE